MTSIAAFIRNAWLDIMSANHLGSALYSPAVLDPARPVNLARVFLDRRSTASYRDWDRIAHDAVGSLRTEAARNPHEALTDLIGELSRGWGGFRWR